MKRLAAHKVFYAESSYISNGVVSIDHEGNFISLFSLNDSPSEPANTRFYDEDIFLMKKGESPEWGATPFLPVVGEPIDIYFHETTFDNPQVSIFKKYNL